MGRPGGPSRMAPEQRQRFLDAVKIGNYAEVAARLAGIPPSTMWRWLEFGRDAKVGQYRDFWEAVKEAEAFAENSAVGMVRRGGKDWVAQMTFLERRFRDRWARPAAGSSIDTPPPPPEGTAPSTVTEEPVTVPLRDRVAGILRVLDDTGQMESHDPEPSNGKPTPAGG